MTDQDDAKAVRVMPQVLEEFIEQLFARCGLSAAHAGIVSNSIVNGLLRGRSSHGIPTLLEYLRRLREGLQNPEPKCVVTPVSEGVAILDADGAMGAIAATIGMKHAVDCARQAGLGAVFVRDSSHFGSASFIVEIATEEGLAGFVVSNSPPTMVAWGGVDPVFGTNPFCAGIPVPGGEPVIIDMATSAVARGRIKKAAELGLEISQEWAVDQHGSPTTDPAAALRGAMLPFGGAKGSAIALVIDFLAGVLSGSGFGKSVGGLTSGERQNVGHFILAINIDHFLDRDEYASRVKKFTSDIGTSGPTGSHKVRLPGEESGKLVHVQREQGIVLDAPSLKILKEASDLVGISPLVVQPQRA